MLKTNVMRILDKAKIGYTPFEYSPELTKAVSMLKQKELLPLTGYIHGGCSPVGMKKKFKTVIDKSAGDLPLFYVSAGRVGYQVRLDPHELAEFIGADFSDITV